MAGFTTALLVGAAVGGGLFAGKKIGQKQGAAQAQAEMQAQQQQAQAPAPASTSGAPAAPVPPSIRPQMASAAAAAGRKTRRRASSANKTAGVKGVVGPSGSILGSGGGIGNNAVLQPKTLLGY